jgi:ribonuclease BN (tRNA processing enzyme)
LRLKVLGCYGGSAPGMRLTSYLVEDRLAIDAGCLTDVLSVREQARISHVFLSHSHIDHIVTLPFLLDNVLPLIDQPVLLYGPEDTIRSLREHIFNEIIWPDFTKIWNGRTHVLRMEPLAQGQTVRLPGVAITPFPMDHAVQCHGHLVQGPDSAVAICSDTVSTAGLLSILPAARNLKAVILEASFPERLARIAELSKHLSTVSFAEEAARIPAEIQILVSHLKPDCAEEIAGEIRTLGMRNVELLEQGREYVF